MLGHGRGHILPLLHEHGNMALWPFGSDTLVNFECALTRLYSFWRSIPIMDIFRTVCISHLDAYLQPRVVGLGCNLGLLLAPVHDRYPERRQARRWTCSCFHLYRCNPAILASSLCELKRATHFPLSPTRRDMIPAGKDSNS